MSGSGSTSFNGFSSTAIADRPEKPFFFLKNKGF
jgi:hypothetical protein